MAPAQTPAGTGKLVGARVRRVEDARILLGKTQYVDDVRIPGTASIAFVRSPYAHARVLKIDPAAARANPGVLAVLTADDLPEKSRVLRLKWDPAMPSPPHRVVEWPVLADGIVRFVGEAVAAVVAEDRYLAEDAAELVEVDYEPLEPVVDMERALETCSPLVHQEWPDNVLQSAGAEFGAVSSAFASADLVISERFLTGRHTALPLEPRGCLAAYDAAAELLTMWSSTQIPHILRTNLAAILGIAENRVRVIAPDVGGGFGLKAHVFPEDIVTAHAARITGRPVKWIEDRRENLIASLHAKHQIVTASLALDRDGMILGLRARCLSDIGAYTEFPFSSGLEAGVAAAAMPGPYKIPAYQFEAVSIATNKASVGAYRGVGMPVAVFVMERLIDIAARRLALDPAELRMRNMIRREDHPYTNIVGFQIESGSHREALAKALGMLGYEEFRARQAALRSQGGYIGVGIASYIETTAPSTAGWMMLGMRMGGYETATVRVDRAGMVTVLVGTHSHGQSHQTTFAQIAADELGVALDDVRIEFGDTAKIPYGWGTGGSRSAVVGGGATMNAAAVMREKILRIAARAAEIPGEDLELRNRAVVRKSSGEILMTIAEAARLAYLPPSGHFAGEQPGLEVTETYEPPLMTHANSTHVVTVEVDADTGQVRLDRYIVVEDCGTMINPMVVDGQIQGGVAQGIGSAILEQIVYDGDGQILTGTLMDYLAPTATDVPRVEIAHLESPSPYTLGGIKGMGEGGAIAPPGALANAIADALAPFGARVNEIPLTPQRVAELIAKGSK
jgi:carbon-monoxide dehydrogenase large subunit